MAKKGDKLTKKQKLFADEYLKTGNGTQSALASYDVSSNNSANSVAGENLQKLVIIKYLAEHAEEAVIRVKELSEQNENLTVALGASKDILDRAGFRPVEKSQTINVNLQGGLKLQDKNAELLAKKYEDELKQHIRGTVREVEHSSLVAEIPDKE